MKVWRTRFISAHVAFWKDDEASMTMALEQFQHVVEPLQQQQLGGSCQQKAPNLNCDRILMDGCLWKDYFLEILIYGFVYLYCYYHIKRSLFNIYIGRMCTQDNYFIQKRDAMEMLGLSLQ